MLRLIPQTETERPLRILCLGSHSDDIEIGCGGTMLHLLQRYPGSSVRWVVFTAFGDRAHEARASAADFLQSGGSSDVVVHEFREGVFPSIAATIKEAFEELKQGDSPDLIFTHRREDLHQDHRVIAELTWNTFRNHVILEYEIPKYEGDLGNPNLFVPLDEAVAHRKIELLMQHFATQRSRGWFRPETFQAMLWLRAVECASPSGFAEAFHARKLCV